jgi:hypothetical protein
MLEKEFQFYLKHQDELVKKYEGKCLVIVGEEVVGAYDSEVRAYDEAISRYKKGEFLIQLCSPGEESYTQTYHSRVVV